jgi:uncharacterized surface protein with fasciclin (FAS1) repeats
MKMKKIRSFALAAASLALAGSVAIATPASADTAGPTLTDLLEAQGGGTDRNWYDFDILAAGVEVAGLSAALDDPNADLTVFLPNDRAFQALIADLYGWRYWFASEAKILAKVAGLGADTLRTVILYHAVSGQIDSATALSVPRGTPLTTLQGGEIRVYPKKRFGTAVLADNDPNDFNPFLVRSKLDIQASNGIAHGISLVLRPIDL